MKQGNASCSSYTYWKAATELETNRPCKTTERLQDYQDQLPALKQKTCEYKVLPTRAQKS